MGRSYTISNSSIDALTSSPRKFWFRYINHMRGEEQESSYLKFGTSLHSLLEETLKKPKHLREEIMMSKIERIADTFDEKFKDRLFRAIPNLINILDKYQVLELELQIKIDHVLNARQDEKLFGIVQKLVSKKYKEEWDGWIGFNGYVDAYVIDNGKKKIIDWKTGVFSQVKFNKYKKQILRYAHAMRVLGYQVDVGEVYFIEQGIAKEIPVDESSAKREFDKMFEIFAEEMKKRGVDFKNYNEDCSMHFKRFCPFAGICGIFNNEYYKMGKVFPEWKFE